ncbi:hypothetical protein GOBAR_DD00966 [Gossypium barbadense]|nr:hypothetical protein GOBAR_DD00966 [Gossypium barbadense]
MQKKEEENGELCETIKEKQDLVPFDGRVGVSGKSAEEAKYVPMKSFANSNVPENVLKCYKDFSSPSPIHAWPFDIIRRPGRLKDMMNNEVCQLKEVSFVEIAADAPNAKKIIFDNSYDEN